MTDKELLAAHYETIKTHATDTAIKRQQYHAAQTTLDERRAKFEQDNADLIASVSRLKTVALASESTLRTATINAFHATGEKKPAPGIAIKLWDAAEYDAIEALRWCRLNMPALLVLNTKAYEKVLRVRADHKVLGGVLPDMPGTVGKGPKTDIAKDLTAYLPTVEQSDPA